MTSVISTSTKPSDDPNQTRAKTVPSTNTAMDPEDYTPIEETRRTAVVWSPLTREYDLPAVIAEVLGRESATCEACQETVYLPAAGDLAEGDPFVLRELVENVYTVENQVLLCESCVNRPTAAWRADVCAKRVQEREHEPTRLEYLAYWVSDPTATSLFARRVAASIVGAVALVAAIVIVAGIVGSLTADANNGSHWAYTTVMTAGTIGVEFVARPWLVGGFVGVAYTAHAVERVHFDPRGYRTRTHHPWVPLTAAGVTAGIGALSLLGTTTGVGPTTPLTQLLAGTIWTIGAVGVAWYIDLAIRHDLAIGIWKPSRGPWMIAGRVGILPGLLALTFGVPFPGVFAPTTTGILAAIPAIVALTFTARRLPYDSNVRDAILDVFPQWLRSALTDDQHRK
ncbi:hypothetical protein [Halorussus halophilus]|uniref:hypothetical protein n=1 Tax=Halorussus halophilus TaxID=2650975 RepID=UPI001300E9E8|nr:hypothetical protein [Halorussus halophilus]